MGPNGLVLFCLQIHHEENLFHTKVNKVHASWEAQTLVVSRGLVLGTTIFINDLLDKIRSATLVFGDNAKSGGP